MVEFIRKKIYFATLNRSKVLIDFCVKVCKSWFAVSVLFWISILMPGLKLDCLVWDVESLDLKLPNGRGWQIYIIEIFLSQMEV